MMNVSIGHVNEYPTMHYLGNPRHTQSMKAYNFDGAFLEVPVKNWFVGMLLTCPIEMSLDMTASTGSVRRMGKKFWENFLLFRSSINNAPVLYCIMC